MKQCQSTACMQAAATKPRCQMDAFILRRSLPNLVDVPSLKGMPFDVRKSSSFPLNFSGSSCANHTRMRV